MGTVPSTYTWSAGEVLTAASLNTYLKDAVTFLRRPPLLIGYGEDTSTSTGVGTVLDFSTAVLDTDSMMDAANDQCDIQTDGEYVAWGFFRWQYNASIPATETTYEAQIRLNGSSSTARQSREGALGNYAMQRPYITILASEESGDYHDHYVTQTTGYSRDVRVYRMSYLWIAATS